MSKKAAVIKGDGVGPELVENMLRVAEAVGTNIEFIQCEAGAEWWQQHGGDSLIPEERGCIDPPEVQPLCQCQACKILPQHPETAW